MKDESYAKVLLEKDGILVNAVEVKDPVTGSHFKITLTAKRVLVKIFEFGTHGEPNFEYRILLPGENRLESAGGVRLLLQIPHRYLPLQASVPFLITYSLKLNISLALINVLGDLSEEFNELKSKNGAVKAKLWYWKQILTSAYPLARQVVRRVLASTVRT